MLQRFLRLGWPPSSMAMATVGASATNRESTRAGTGKGRRRPKNLKLTELVTGYLLWKINAGLSNQTTVGRIVRAPREPVSMANGIKTPSMWR